MYDNNNTATSAGTSDNTTTWTVPAGVTEVFFECWGGGGGGCYASGGGGGAYAAFKLAVVPSQIVTLQVGAGGNSGSFTTNGIKGGNTTIDYYGVNVFVYGGFGGSYSNVGATNSFVPPPSGGAVGSNIPTSVYYEFGQPGAVTRISFMQIAANEFAKVFNFGGGGDAGHSPGSGAKGGYTLDGTSFRQYAYSSSAVITGGGGPSDNNYGWSGKGGRIILRY